MEVIKPIVTGVKVLGKVLYKNLPALLTGAGCGLMFGAIVETGVRTPKFQEYMIDAELDIPQARKEHPLEIIQIGAKAYWPVIILAGGAVFCFCRAHKIQLDRTGAALALYQLNAAKLNDLEDKIVQVDGEKKLAKLKDSIAEDKAADINVSENDIIKTIAGDSLFLEPITGQVVSTNYEKIFKAVDFINREISDGGSLFVPLSWFLEEIGIEPTDVSDNIGWETSADGQLPERLWITTNVSKVITVNGVKQACMILDYGSCIPKWNYNRYR